MTTTTTTATKNTPAFAISYIDERRVDKTLAAILGKTLKEGDVDTRKIKCGVGFITPKENVNFFIGDRTDPARKSFLMLPTSHKEQAIANDGLPVGDIFLRNGDNIDFKNDKCGEAFLNQDGSYTLIIGPSRNETARYEMRALPQPVAPKPAEKAAEPAVAAEPAAEPAQAATKPNGKGRNSKTKPEAAAPAAA
jgi:hypothetical protein